MKTLKPWVKNSLNIGALTAGALLASGTAASASPTMTSTDNLGILNGTQVLAPIQAPIDICGNAVAAAGAAYAACQGGAAATLDPEWSFDHYRAGPAAGGPTLVSTDNVGVGNGTQVYAPIQVPVSACGNAVGVLGAATATCQGGATADHGKDRPSRPGKDRPGKDRHGKGGYHQDDDKYGHSGKGGKQDGYAYQPEAEVVATNRGGPTMTSAGNVGLLNGTQALLPIQIPISICGNAIGVLGTAQAACEGGASATNQL